MCPYGAFRGKKFLREEQLIGYDKEVGTNYYNAFLSINKERIEIDGIEIKGEDKQMSLFDLEKEETNPCENCEEQYSVGMNDCTGDPQTCGVEVK
jgi:hypothetical protein